MREVDPIYDPQNRGNQGGGSNAGSGNQAGQSGGNSGGNTNLSYNRDKAVSFETWQSELSFDRQNGRARETQARNSGDARHWYNNYVATWNNADASTRYAIDQQHGFYGGQLVDNTPKPVAAPAAPPPAPAPAAPPPAPAQSLDPPEPEEISPSPDPATLSSNESSDQTPETNATTVDVEVEEDSKPIVEADTAAGLTDDDSGTDYTILSQDDEVTDEDDSLLTVRDVTPEDEVVDPATGRRYPTPADARRAGITTWVWAYNYTGDEG